jgi:hypothetical protein
MTGTVDKAMADHVEATLGLAEKILKSAGDDANDAFLTAIGTLAQVMFCDGPTLRVEGATNSRWSSSRDCSNHSNSDCQPSISPSREPFFSCTRYDRAPVFPLP